MDISGANSLGSLDSQQGMLVAKKALDAMKAQGQMALKLVETAATTGQAQVQSPQNPEGTGKIVDVRV
ncbi:hypothetical protein [Candidatus Magnetomonas plexicatena]|uniref:hypothetical protein n=1 Tax=Candidatus Magnetomonas plexicatena TaxID=2552947 RepID=UPI0011046905|nr:hypothetical protein E2O03_000415 [Nitrospirales bacterium LBB_01]